VIQTTPYIGHPAYKAMGGRAAYVLATALFVGSAGVLGYFGYLYVVIPRNCLSDSYFHRAGDRGSELSRHARSGIIRPSLACVPALAQLALIFIDKKNAAGLHKLAVDVAASEEAHRRLVTMKPLDNDPTVCNSAVTCVSRGWSIQRQDRLMEGRRLSAGRKPRHERDAAGNAGRRGVKALDRDLPPRMKIRIG